MGVRAWLGWAAVIAAVLALPARSAAGTVTEPIARLGLEGGYDSNALYDGSGSDRTGRVSPELGVRVRDHLWDLSAIYRGDYLVYDRLAPGGIWNHRGTLRLAAEPTRRLELGADLRGAYAFDPVGLAQMGIFRAGRQSAWTVQGRGRAEYRVSRRVDAALTLTERAVVFDDDTGGAMHAPGAEALWRLDRRLSVGAGYALGLFQGFEGDGTDHAMSNGLRARARYRITRHLLVNAHAGPALWVGNGDRALVPEAGAELQLTNRQWDLRAEVQHGLGIGSTARPGLVDSAEVGFVRRLGRTRRYDVRGDGGIWRSGRAPSGGDTTLGFAGSAEAGMTFAEHLRVAVGVAHFARLDDATSALRRTTVGLRLGWSWDAR